MQPLDLLGVATALLEAQRGKPTMAYLRRATSSAYYAMFHHICRSCADLLIGGQSADRSPEAWRQVYRALDHSQAKQRCLGALRAMGFPPNIVDFANIFVDMQDRRHAADYDPTWIVSKSQVQLDVDRVAGAIEAFSAAKAKDRRAFCAYLLFRNRPA